MPVPNAPASTPSAPAPATTSVAAVVDALEAAFRLLCSEIMNARTRWVGDGAARARLDHAFLDLTHHASQALSAAGDPDLLEEVQRVLLHEGFVSALNLYAITLSLRDDAATVTPPGVTGSEAALERISRATIDLLEAFRPCLPPTDEDLRAVLIDGAPVRAVIAARAAARTPDR